MTFADATLTRKRTTTTVDVSVDVDITDLADNGWHHEDDCPAAQGLGAVAPDRLALADAIRSLHRQAHPSQPADPYMCREEPCRSLPADCVFSSMSKR